jgi:hypothetical protein
LLLLGLAVVQVINCSACGHFEPNEWCWEGRLDCPFGKPPRYLTASDVLDYARGLEKRIAALESPS